MQKETAAQKAIREALEREEEARLVFETPEEKIEREKQELQEKVNIRATRLGILDQGAKSYLGTDGQSYKGI